MLPANKWIVVATDGTTNRKLFWLNVASGGVYYNQCIIGSGGHKSHHKDGTINLHLLPFRRYQARKSYIGYLKQKFKSERLEDIDFGLLGAHVIYCDLSREDYELYKPKGNEKRVINIDVREFENPDNAFDCSIYMVASSQHERFEKAMEKYTEKRIIYITEWEPHIALLLQNVQRTSR